MSRYPVLEVNIGKIYNNTRIVTGLCRNVGIRVAGIIKGFGGIPEGAEAMAEGGCIEIGSSRTEQLMAVKEYGVKADTLLVRMPMACEIPDVVRYADISLNSEKDALDALNEEAARQGKVHRVILMYDLGDLREGVFTEQELKDLALYAERDLESIYLEGIGTNLSCYGSVAPTQDNLGRLADAAGRIEAMLGRKLCTVSGGATTSVPLLVKEGLPAGINHLRLGESIINTQDLPLYWDCRIDGLDADTFVLKAQVIEVNSKPTHPIGRLMVNAFGESPVYADRGIRKRAIVALGNQDVGDCMKLIPKDKNMSVVGASSDHTILDIEDSLIDYRIGDTVEFNVLYQAMLMASISPYIRKEIV